jgi:hypothetical protein
MVGLHYTPFSHAVIANTILASRQSSRFAQIPRFYDELGRAGTQMIPAALANVVKMSNIEHFSAVEGCNYVAVKTKELTLKQILSVPCPTCGAATESPCELHTGAPRTGPHRDRRLAAAEAAEKKFR